MRVPGFGLPSERDVQREGAGRGDAAALRGLADPEGADVAADRAAVCAASRRRAYLVHADSEPVVALAEPVFTVISCRHVLGAGLASAAAGAAAATPSPASTPVAPRPSSAVRLVTRATGARGPMAAHQVRRAWRAVSPRTLWVTASDSPVATSHGASTRVSSRSGLRPVNGSGERRTEGPGTEHVRPE